MKGKKMSDINNAERHTKVDTTSTETHTMADFEAEINQSFKKMDEGFFDDNWDKIMEIKDQDEPFEVEIKGAVKGGLVADLEGIRAFIPASRLSLKYVEESELPSYVGKNIMVKIIDADPEENKLYLSAKEILKAEAEKQKTDAMTKVEVGQVFEGTVASIQNYGAFVDLSNGLTGLVHISQISNERIAHPGKVLKEGQNVKVKIIAIKDGKLSLSIKALQDESTEDSETEHIEYENGEEASTSMGDILKKLGL